MTGWIVDIRKDDDGTTYYTVEGDEYGYVDDPDVYNAGYPLYTCTVDQLCRL